MSADARIPSRLLLGIFRCFCFATDPKLTEIRKSEADSKHTAPATEDDEELSSLSLKTILDRVEQAKENIRNGMPVSTPAISHLPV